MFINCDTGAVVLLLFTYDYRLGRFHRCVLALAGQSSSEDCKSLNRIIHRARLLTAVDPGRCFLCRLQD